MSRRAAETTQAAVARALRAALKADPEAEWEIVVRRGETIVRRVRKTAEPADEPEPVARNEGYVF